MKTTIKLWTLTALLGPLLGGCISDTGRAPNESDRAIVDPVGGPLVDFGARYAAGVTRSLKVDGLHDVTPSDPDALIADSRASLIAISELLDTDILDDWVDAEEGLDDLITLMASYRRNPCAEVDPQAGCTQLGILREEVSAIVEAADGLLARHMTPEAKESTSNLVHAPQIQLLVGIELAHMAEAIVLDQLDGVPDRRIEGDQDDLCAAALDHHALLTDLRADVDEAVEARYGDLELMTEWIYISSTKKKRITRGCFEAPVGTICTDASRIEIFRKLAGTWRHQSTQGVSTDELLLQADARRAQAISNDRTMILGDGGLDSNLGELQRIGSCVDVPGPSNSFCDLLGGERVTLQSTHGTYLQALDERKVGQADAISDQTQFLVSCEENDLVTLTAPNGSLLIAPPHGRSIEQGAAKDWEHLFAPAYQANGTWALETAQGSYVGALEDGNVAQTDDPDGSARFSIRVLSE